MLRCEDAAAAAAKRFPSYEGEVYRSREERITMSRGCYLQPCWRYTPFGEKTCVGLSRACLTDVLSLNFCFVVNRCNKGRGSFIIYSCYTCESDTFIENLKFQADIFVLTKVKISDQRRISLLLFSFEFSKINTRLFVISCDLKMKNFPRNKSRPRTCQKHQQDILIFCNKNIKSASLKKKKLRI